MRKLLLPTWLAVGLLLYVLSSGPAWCVVRHMQEPIDKMRMLYFPITLLGDDVNDAFERYVTWWAPPLH